MAKINKEHQPDRQNWLSSAGPAACAVVGAMYAVLGAFPVAALVALVYRFPIAFSGYASGFRAMQAAPISIAFFLFFGGFLIFGLLGAIAGLTAHARYVRRSYRNKHREIVVAAAVIDFAVVLLLSVWDKIYGPW